MGTGVGRSRRKGKNAGIISIPSSRAQMVSGAGIGGNGSASPRGRCWKFGIMRATGNARKAVVGTDIWGEVAGPNVIVHSDVGTLGDAPAQIARSIIEALPEYDGGRLRGNVIKKTASDVRVELCTR